MKNLPVKFEDGSFNPDVHFSQNSSFKASMGSATSMVAIDKTLTKEGQAADAKATGDAIAEKQDRGDYVQTVNGKKPDESGNIEIQDGVNFTTDETLSLSEEGVLSVNTANKAEEDNTLPITSAAVAASVGNIEILLQNI